jgi:hypothetical protein
MQGPLGGQQEIAGNGEDKMKKQKRKRYERWKGAG